MTTTPQRCNCWLLHTALAHGANRVRLVCLWNGGGGGVAGGTGHMSQEMKNAAGSRDLDRYPSGMVKWNRTIP